MSEQRQPYEQGQSHRETRRGKASGDSESKIARDMEEVFQRLIANAVTLIGVRAGVVELLSPTTRKLKPLAIYSVQGRAPSTPDYAGVAGWVVANRTPAIIDQATNDPRMQTPGGAPSGSLVCVPLLAGQEVLGTLLLTSPRPASFTHQHVKLLEALADVAAITVLHARQLEASAHQTHLLTTVVEVARALSHSSEMPQVLGLTTAGIRRLISCEEAVLFSYEDHSQELCGVAGLGTQSARLADQRILISDPQSVTAWVARQRRPLLHSSGSRAFVGPITDTLLTRQDLALLAVPLIARERLWGVITLARPAPFDTNDLRTMLNLANFVAPALAQASRVETRR